MSLPQRLGDTARDTGSEEIIHPEIMIYCTSTWSVEAESVFIDTVHAWRDRI
jgi:hypothetical protein